MLVIKKNLNKDIDNLTISAFINGKLGTSDQPFH